MLLARIVKPFLTAHATLGLPRTGDWQHFAIQTAPVYRQRLLTAGQAMAAKREDFGTVARALADFPPEAIETALRVLKADAVNRSEKFIGPVQWLADLHAARAVTKNSRARDNLLWLAIATAPDGYCHPRASVVGTLLEDIIAGLPFEDIRSRFNAKTHTLIYQRPQAAPTAGAIAAAERAVEALGIAPSLKRRFARLDDLETIWTPSGARQEKTGGGVFGHIKPKDAPADVRTLNIPVQTVTWEKFAKTVLPNAKAIEIMVPSHGAFIALTSAVHADAPPILKWDREDYRYPVAWYVYPGGSRASQWGLSAGWNKVTAITPLPPMCGDKPQPHLGEGVILVIEGAVDSANGGMALFPECMRSELHGVRSVIEAHSRSGILEGRAEASACGYDIRKGGRANVTVRVLEGGGWTAYTIDRWD